MAKMSELYFTMMTAFLLAAVALESVSYTYRCGENADPWKRFGFFVETIRFVSGMKLFHKFRHADEKSLTFGLSTVEWRWLSFGVLAGIDLIYIGVKISSFGKVTSKCHCSQAQLNS
jgi:hypothetical protein